jgi:hypothetical protein
MRKVIKGKLYDTETATMVAEFSSGYSNDFAYVSETLYRKRTGEYFVYGEGGAMSKYAKSCGQNQWMGGAAIKPVTYDEARTWLEEHGTAEEYEAEFGIPDEGAEHDLHVIISESAWQAISRRAASEGSTVRNVIEAMASNL